MGDLYLDEDYYIDIHVAGLNLRFAPGPPLDEMVDLQRKFRIFSLHHRFEDIISLLNVAGGSWELRDKWRRLLSWIAGLGSDRPGKTGGEAIIGALQHELESATPRPFHFTTHSYEVNPRVLVNTTGERVFFYINSLYVVVSLPLRSRSF
ncbi:MAG TPA: hypothetical protein VKC66_22715 [Xanthobacteraceae bacterium]|nr:hypothetical protein [Xanthobacteraceae bacterium]